MTRNYQRHPEGRYLTPVERREIISLFIDTVSIDDISRRTGRSKVSVSDTITLYLRGKARQQVHHAFRKDIEATDYSQHDEYSRHFAGAEYEDNRPPHERGKDWPIKGYL